MSDYADSYAGLPKRRTVIAAAAWSVPVIAAVTATPAFAASSSPPAGVALSWKTLTAQANGYKIGGTFGLEIQAPGMTAVASVTLYLKDSSGKVLRTLKPGTYTLAPDRNAIQFTFPNNLRKGGTFRVEGIVSGTLTSWRDTKTGITYTGNWSLKAVPKTADPATITISPK